MVQVARVPEWRAANGGANGFYAGGAGCRVGQHLQGPSFKKQIDVCMKLTKHKVLDSTCRDPSALKSGRMMFL